MAKKNDGGSAFPVLYISSPEPGDYRTFAEGGMTLRDYFAAKAVQALISMPGAAIDGRQIEIPKDSDHLAGAAYSVADAMLSARKRARKK